jgi:hypothetical protein
MGRIGWFAVVAGGDDAARRAGPRRHDTQPAEDDPAGGLLPPVVDGPPPSARWFGPLARWLRPSPLDQSGTSTAAPVTRPAARSANA